jgi:hypothetical protein
VVTNGGIQARWQSDARGLLRYEDGNRVIESWLQTEPIFILHGCPNIGRESAPTVRVTAIRVAEAECRVIHKRVLCCCPWLMMSRTNGGCWAWISDSNAAWAIELELTRVFEQAGVSVGVDALDRYRSDVALQTPGR